MLTLMAKKFILVFQVSSERFRLKLTEEPNPKMITMPRVRVAVWDGEHCSPLSQVLVHCTAYICLSALFLQAKGFVDFFVCFSWAVFVHQEMSGKLEMGY
jgi:hypothetical protein